MVFQLIKLDKSWLLTLLLDASVETASNQMESVIMIIKWGSFVANIQQFIEWRLDR